MRNRRTKRKSVNRNKKITILTYGIVFGIILVFSVIFSLINVGNDKTLIGVKIENIDFSNLTRQEAKQKLEDWYNNVLLQDINVHYEELEETISIKELEPEINADEILNQVFEISKSGNIIKDNYSILFTMLFQKKYNLEIKYNTEKLEKEIENISGKLPGAAVDTNYYIENEELIIKKGEPGVKIDTDKFISEINVTMQSDNKTIEIPVKDVQIEDINIDKIHEEIYKEAQDAYISQKPTQVHTHVNGVEFAISIDEAKKIIEEDKDEYIIPLKITIPNKTIDSLGEEAFPQRIAEFTTRYDASNKNRSINLGLASNKINGTIVLPGEIFSYNKVVGQRTISEGYKEAAVYSGGKVVQGIGGGICQLSSTLYNTVLYSNLEITSRSNHRFLTSYVQAGRDATVSWGTIDFCFKNTRTYPIKIASTVQNGIVRVEIYGIKEETEYEIELQTNIIETIPYTTNYIKDSTLDEGTEVIEQYGSDGAKSETYKIVKLNGITISKALLSTDTYSSLERVIRKGTKKVQKVEETQETSTNVVEID